MNKRLKVAMIAAPVLALSVGGVIYALPDKKPQTKTEQNYNAQQMGQPQPPATPSQTSEAFTTQAQTTTPSTPKPVVASTPTPTPAQPAYGEDPNRPGIFIVFDKVAVMDGADIPTADRQYVEALITSWVYKGSNEAQNLCGTLPRSKMAPAGADYDTSPITQLKWCNNYAVARYGSWQAAYNYKQNNSSHIW